MTYLLFYLRAHRAPAAAATSAAAIALFAAVWVATMAPATMHAGLAALTAALALAPLVPTLAGNDAALERTAARPWPPRRALHLLATGALITALLATARLLGADFGTLTQIVRNAAGLAGLAGLTAALAGAGLAWIPPIVWAGIQAVLAVPDGPAWRQAALWMVQPAGSRAAALTAAFLLLTGLIAYALRPGPPVAASETAVGD